MREYTQREQALSGEGEDFSNTNPLQLISQDYKYQVAQKYPLGPGKRFNLRKLGAADNFC